MGRLGIRFANAALFALCCFQVAAVVNRISADLLMPPPPSFQSSAADAAQVAQSWDQRKPILDRNLFGAELYPLAQAPAPPPVEELEETRLPLRLLGTMAAATAMYSKAVIAERGTRGYELVRVGDHLEAHPEVSVAHIERRRVILQNGSRREELLLEEDAGAAAPRPVASRQSRRSRRSRPTPPARPPLAERLRELQSSQAGSRTAREIFSQAKIVPKFEGGEMVGMELSQIEAGSLYEKVGLQDGDIITALNGIRLDSAAASTKVLSQFVEADEFVIELADQTVKTVSAAELEEILGDEDGGEEQ